MKKCGKCICPDEWYCFCLWVDDDTGEISSFKHYGEYLFRKDKQNLWSRPTSAISGYVTANSIANIITALLVLVCSELLINKCVFNQITFCSDPFTWKKEKLLRGCAVVPIGSAALWCRASIAQSINRTKDLCAQGLLKEVKWIC